MDQTQGHSAPLGELYAVKGGELWLHKAGEGGPAVVFLAGAGLIGLDYFAIHERVARFTTSVLYDRRGAGWSSAELRDRSAAATVDELHSLLNAAGVAPPYLLVGHSLGGLLARRFLQLHPAEVTGLILLDTAHEDYHASMPDRLKRLRGGVRGLMLKCALAASRLLVETLLRVSPRLLERLGPVKRQKALYRSLFEAVTVGWSPPIQAALVKAHLDSAQLVTGIREAQEADTLYREVRRAGTTPSVPTIFFCAMGSDAFRKAVSRDEADAAIVEEGLAKRQLYQSLAREHGLAEVRDLNCGHVTLPFQEATTIADAVHEMLRS